MSSGADAVSQSPTYQQVNLCWNIKIIVVRLLKTFKKKKLLHKFIKMEFEFVLFVQQEN